MYNISRGVLRTHANIFDGALMNKWLMAESC